MSPVSILMLGFAMSTDAFAAAIGKGAQLHKPRLRDALRAGAIFGGIEASTPLVGWLLGRAASRYVEAFDHWIAFALLLVLGLHMIVAGVRGGAVQEEGSGSRRYGFWALAMTGLATSIDAMAIGVGLAFIDVNIVVVAAAIGLCTLTMVTIGIMVGRAIGTLVGSRAEILGGAILILIGAVILYEHLHGAA